jgi:hypothetical protein
MIKVLAPLTLQLRNHVLRQRYFYVLALDICSWPEGYRTMMRSGLEDSQAARRVGRSPELIGYERNGPAPSLGSAYQAYIQAYLAYMGVAGGLCPPVSGLHVVLQGTRGALPSITIPFQHRAHTPQRPTKSTK